MQQQTILDYEADGRVLNDYVHDDSPRILIMGPLGSGKTQASCYKVLKFMTRQIPNNEGVRRSRWYAVRNTYSDLMTTTWKDWMELFEDLGRAVKGGSEPPTHWLDFDLSDGTRVESSLVFMAMDIPKDVKKVKGSNATGMWLNEIKELPFEIFNHSFARTGRFPPKRQEGCTWRGIIADYNACDTDHPLYEKSEVERPKGWSFHIQPPAVLRDGKKRDLLGRQVWKLNPKAENSNNLRDDYYSEQLNGAKEDWIKVNLANEYGFVADGKPVYPEYVDHVHCIDEYKPSPDLPIIVGIDFGRTPAAALLQKIPAIGRYIGFDEFTSEDMSASKFAPELKKYLDSKYPGFKFEIWGDPAGDKKGEAVEEEPMLILRKHGIMCRPCDTNNPLVRRSSIINPMTDLRMDGSPGFLVTKDCKTWRKGLAGGFCYKRIQISGEEKYKDLPDKNQYSHVCEAGEYALLGSGEGRQALRPNRPMLNTSFIAKMDFNVFE